MSGENNLGKLLGSMQPVLNQDVYVFVTTEKARDWTKLQPKLVFEEEEGTTLILRKVIAEEQGIPYVFPSRMVTLNIHSALDAVGFIAIVASRLANEDISVNPVSAYFHDHLFVPEDRAGHTMEVLQALAQEHGE